MDNTETSMIDKSMDNFELEFIQLSNMRVPTKSEWALFRESSFITLMDLMSSANGRGTLLPEQAQRYFALIERLNHWLLAIKLDQIPVVSLNEVQGYSQDKCSICLRDWTMEDKVSRLICNHTFDVQFLKM